ncbi:MAG TPA: alkaline phosphatase family protein [Mycobacteriales bacterium]|nr:alkaline phosphatase family protein [Mycobacteriales bacterium]
MVIRPTRRGVLLGGAALAAGAGGVARALPRVDVRPDPSRPEGTVDPSFPFDHLVVVMMENHSFDNYFGMLPKRGQPLADGFRFGPDGKPTNSNPMALPDGRPGHITAYKMPSVCQMESSPSQAWNASHQQVNGGRMDGFLRAEGNTDCAMGYWDDDTLPFYYSLASTFTLANRWFASAPCQTYPNRRFLMAGTAFGLVSSVVPGPFDAPPANGTIFDRLNAHGISWANYFTDLPQTVLIPQIAKSNPTKLRPVAEFFTDCAAGTLPAVSFVDPDFGLLDVIGSHVPGDVITPKERANGADEENPQNIQLGEAFVAQVVNAVMSGAKWDRTLLVWTYDEHGGYYDHVPPPPAVKPDGIPPNIGPKDVPGGYDMYGLRVPAVVVSPYAKPKAVTNVVHDHTSVLATIEAWWNLPPMTHRDAAATTLLDFLDLHNPPAFLDPPALTPAAVSPHLLAACSTDDPGVKPVSDAKAATTHPTNRRSHRAATAPTVRQPGGALAATGLPDALPEVALLGLAAAAAFSARHRKTWPATADLDDAT